MQSHLPCKSLKPYVEATKRLSVDYGNMELNRCSSQDERQGSPFALSLESASSRVDYNRHIGLLMQKELNFWDEYLESSHFDDSLSEPGSERKSCSS